MLHFFLRATGDLQLSLAEKKRARSSSFELVRFLLNKLLNYSTPMSREPGGGSLLLGGHRQKEATWYRAIRIILLVLPIYM